MGDLRAKSAGRDEFTPALWVDLEPLQFDLGAQFNVAVVARFALVGGVDSKAIEAGLDPTRRRSTDGKSLEGPDVSALELGVKARYFPWGDAALRPYAGLQLSYATLGAVYTSTGSSASAMGGRAATQVPEVHRHRGVGAKLVLGVRWDVAVHAFATAMLAPIALELSYTHNTWLDLKRDRGIELDEGKLVGEGPFVDYLGASVLVGFLR